MVTVGVDVENHDHLGIYSSSMSSRTIDTDFKKGIVSMCQGAVKNYAGLLATRFFLGLAEAGFYPGVLYVYQNTRTYSG